MANETRPRRESSGPSRIRKTLASSRDQALDGQPEAGSGTAGPGYAGPADSSPLAADVPRERKDREPHREEAPADREPIRFIRQRDRDPRA